MSDRAPLFLLSTVESDSHMWNLVYLQLLLEESGIDVINLGPCVATATTLEKIREIDPDVVLISSVNGHGYWQGRALREAVAREFGERAPPFLIGGKLTTNERNNGAVAAELLQAGYAGVFVGNAAIQEFRRWLTSFERSFTPRAELSLAAQRRIGCRQRDVTSEQVKPRRMVLMDAAMTAS